MNAQSPASPDLLLGIDIGGTKISVSCGTSAGRVLAAERFETDHSRPPSEIVERAIDLLFTLVPAGARPLALGVSCPGPMSSREGRFHDPPNMPRWHGFALLEHIRARTEVPSRMMNDANAGALAEWLWGAARGCESVVFCTMSTGMGAGLILDGRLLEGPDDLAGEIGHIRLDPDGPVGFAKRGSVEGYLSGAGLVQLARAEVLIESQRGRESALLAGGRAPREITPRDLCAAALAGDAAARRALARAADALGRLAALLTDLLNPEVIVLGTIASAYPDLFIEPARAVLEREAIARAARRVRLVPSGLGSQRGDLAALAIAHEHHRLERAGGRIPPPRS